MTFSMATKRYIYSITLSARASEAVRYGKSLVRWLMAKKFKVGDHVSWNSEAGRVSGTIVRVHKSDLNYKGYMHHATKNDPQYEIKSDRTDHMALHKGKSLTHLRH